MTAHNASMHPVGAGCAHCTNTETLARRQSAAPAENFIQGCDLRILTSGHGFPHERVKLSRPATPLPPSPACPGPTAPYCPP